MTQLREISIANYLCNCDALEDGSDDSNAYLASFLSSLTSTGFLFLTGHSLSHTEIDATMCLAREFFNLPEEQKFQWTNKDKAKRGYSPYESDNFACLIGEQKPNDLVEKLRFGPEIDKSDPYYTRRDAKAHFMPNTWIGDCEEFRSAICLYYSKMQLLTLRLLEITALALQLPRNYFTSNTQYHTSILTLNYYPHIAPTHRLRIAQHTDISLLTIIAQSSANGGLQIHSNGEWINVPYVPEALVVNVGDCLAYWTNNVLKSTLHRVIAPADTSSSADRISLAYFAAPNFDAPLIPISHIQDSTCSEKSILTYTKWRKKRIKEAMHHLL